jgi:hypothetical protein
MRLDQAVFQLDAWMVAGFFLVAMLFFWGVGWQSGRKRPPKSDDAPAMKFTDSSLAILGLLLAFTFSMALGMHDHRRLMVVQESNAIGDFFTSASILKDPYRSALQSLIRTYTTNEVRALARFQRDAEQRELTNQSKKMQDQMITLVAAAVAEGTPIAVSLTNTLNEVTSANASRLAAYEAVLPWSILALLLLAACVPSFLIGRMQGIAGKSHFSAILSFIVLVTLIAFVTLDLNQGRRGLIRVNIQSFERLDQSMNDLAIPSSAPQVR